MANILDAAAQGTRKTVTGSARSAKEAVMDQFDPRGALYKLGLGVGPIIKQTVIEYNKQQKSKSKTEEKKQDVVDIKKATKTTATNLSGMNAQLRSMNILLKDIRNLSNAQLKAQNQLTKNTGESKTFSASPISSWFNNDKTDEKTSKPQADDSSSFGMLAKIGLGLVAGGVAFKNRDAIKGFLDDFLKGAGLPNSGELADEVGTQVKKTTKYVGKLIGQAIVESVTDTYNELKPIVAQYVKEGLGVGTDKEGNSLPVNKTNLGGMAGASMGFLGGKKMFGWKGGILGGIGGFFGGEAYPEEAAGLAMAGAGLYGTYKGVSALNKIGAARAAAPQAVTPTTPAAAIAAPWQVATGAPSSPLRVGEKMTPGGIIIPEAAGSRSASQQLNMDRLAQGQLTSMEKAGVRVSEAVDAVGKAGKQAGAVFSKYGGKILGALNVAMTLPQIYDDIENGDYAAAGMEAAGLIGSIGSAALTPFITPAGAAAVGFGVSAASTYAASRLRTPKTTGANLTETDTKPAPETNAAKPSETPAGTKPEETGNMNRSLLSLKFSDLTEEEKQQILAGQAKAEGWYAGSMSFRNNNPGNLKFADWMKEFGGVRGETASDGGSFARFPSKQAGSMAQRRQWERPLYAGLTIAQGLKKWHTSNDPTVIANYAKTVTSGTNIAVGDINSPTAIASGAAIAGATPTPSVVQARDLKSLGLADDQIATLMNMQQTIKGFNNSLFDDEFSGLMQAISAAVTPASAPTAAAPSGGSNKTPPSVPPVSMYKEKHSFGQAKAPWYASGGTLPAFQ